MNATAALPRGLLARLPGWEDADATPLPGGSNNAVFLLVRAGRRAVLKLAITPRKFPLNARNDEARIQAEAHAAGLAPRVLYADERLLLEEYVAGSPVSAADLARPANLEELGRALRRLHALPPIGRRFPLREAARLYRDTLPPGTDGAAADRCLALIDATPPGRPLCRCHNDLVAGNVLAGDTLCLLDWEYAADNDPLFDLAAVVTEFRVGPAGARVLLDACFDDREGESGAGRSAALAHMCAVYQALTWLWRASRESSLVIPAPLQP